MSRKHRLIEIEWPTFGACEPPARASVAEFESRIEAARAAMDGLGLTHLVVYGDREHFANLAWLTGFDPRFEEALLIIARSGRSAAGRGQRVRGVSAGQSARTRRASCGTSGSSPSRC